MVMGTIRLNILHERAMEVIRYLEKVQDVEVVEESTVPPIPQGSKGKDPEDRVQRQWYGILNDDDTSKIEDPEHGQPTRRTSWAGAIQNPSKELLEYADKVRDEWDHRI